MMLAHDRAKLLPAICSRHESGDHPSNFHGFPEITASGRIVVRECSGANGVASHRPLSWRLESEKWAGDGGDAHSRWKGGVSEGVWVGGHRHAHAHHSGDAVSG